MERVAKATLSFFAAFISFPNMDIAIKCLFLLNIIGIFDGLRFETDRWVIGRPVILVVE